MELKISNVRRELFTGINNIFVERGFRQNLKNSEFRREIDNCKHIFDFFFYKEENRIALEPRLRIKVEAIEREYRAITDIPGRPYLCLGNHLFKIVSYFDHAEEIDKGYSQNWLISDEEQIKKLISVIPRYLDETVIPYFNKNSSVKRVDELLNKYPRELSIHNNIYPLRANIAIIAAKLNSNTRYHELINIYEEELKGADATYKNEFFKLKEHLRRFNDSIRP